MQRRETANKVRSCNTNNPDSRDWDKTPRGPLDKWKKEGSKWLNPANTVISHGQIN